MTQPNPLKTNFRPIPDPTQSNPTRESTQPMDNSGLDRQSRRSSLLTGFDPASQSPQLHEMRVADDGSSQDAIC